ncbi:2OG-Fe(II) oxygenase family protein, partial [bacterium]|nr:2OG-Fe(II) oxygenase family protein [bacterium]
MSHFQEASPDVYDWQLRMWANVTPPGGLNQPHAHPGNLCAAVRYLDMGDEVESDEDVGGAFNVE